MHEGKTPATIWSTDNQETATSSSPEQVAFQSNKGIILATSMIQHIIEHFGENVKPDTSSRGLSVTETPGIAYFLAKSEVPGWLAYPPYYTHGLYPELKARDGEKTKQDKRKKKRKDAGWILHGTVLHYLVCSLRSVNCIKHLIDYLCTPSLLQGCAFVHDSRGVTALDRLLEPSIFAHLPVDKTEDIISTFLQVGFIPFTSPSLASSSHSSFDYMHRDRFSEVIKYFAAQYMEEWWFIHVELVNIFDSSAEKTLKTRRLQLLSLLSPWTSLVTAQLVSCSAVSTISCLFLFSDLVSFVVFTLTHLNFLTV